VADAPPRAFADDLGEVAVGEVHEAARPHPRGDGPEQRVHQLAQARADLILGQGRPDQPHAAVDVEADAPRRDDAGVGPEGGHSADREAVAPVAVGHAEGGADDAGQAGDVGDLLEDAGVHLTEQGL
jgi:hypothetical protein